MPSIKKNTRATVHTAVVLEIGREDSELGEIHLRSPQKGKIESDMQTKSKNQFHSGDLATFLIW